ncbi:DUF1054 family protein [Lacticaseibacillus sp. GG6-2]
MFELTDLRAFAEPSLEGRLAIIRRDLDPKFESAGEVLAALAQAAGVPQQTVHIAKHARRHKNPPPDTWLALAANTRGYKMMPHVELGFWDDRLFLWLAVLQDSKPLTIDQAAIAPLCADLPEQTQLAGDHTDKLAAHDFSSAALVDQTTQFNSRKKAEWLIGKTYVRTDPLWQTPDALWLDIQRRFSAMMPVYQELGQEFIQQR